MRCAVFDFGGGMFDIDLESVSCLLELISFIKSRSKNITIIRSLVLSILHKAVRNGFDLCHNNHDKLKQKAGSFIVPNFTLHRFEHLLGVLLQFGRRPQDGFLERGQLANVGQTPKIKR